MVLLRSRVVRTERGVPHLFEDGSQRATLAFMRSREERRTPASPTATTLRRIVRDYRSRFGAARKREDAWYRSAPTFQEAVRRAAACQNELGKRCSHQRRIPRAALRAGVATLAGASWALRSCRSFEELHSHVHGLVGGIRGVGRLYVYDVAARIGVVLGLRPRRVYLHAGTRDGARALGLDFRADSIDVTEFPRGLRELKAWELEDVLCIYKSELAGLTRGEGRKWLDGCGGAPPVDGCSPTSTRRPSCAT